MALKELVERPTYPGTLKYTDEAEERLLFRAVVPDMVVGDLIQEIKAILDRQASGAFIYSIQVFKPYNVQTKLSGLDTTALSSEAVQDEAKRGSFCSDVLYGTKRDTMLQILNDVLVHAQEIGITLRARSGEPLTHKTLRLITERH